MLKHEEFRAGGKVSVWIGNFTSDQELDDYLNLSLKFEEDFGIEFGARDMPETVVERDRVPIRDLIDGFSWSESYAEAVVSLAEEKGLCAATTMVVAFNLAYDPVRAGAKIDACLTFIGVVPFS